MRRPAALVTLSALLAISLLLPGCYDDTPELSRYPKVAIPGYTAKDYYLFLYSKDNELVYNAICNLIDDAGSMASALSDEKADKKSAKYVLTAFTYKRIVELLQSRDEKIVSAALRFLQLFAPGYKKKEELTEPVLKVRRMGKNVRYEQLGALDAIASKDSPVSAAFLEMSLKDPSWLVSRASYYLVDRLENDSLRTMLIAKYRSTDAEYEKLLILNSMRSGLSSGVFAFLSREALDTRSEKIKDLILRVLRNARDTAEVLKWVEENHAKLTPGDIERISNHSDLDDDFTSALYGVYIRNGWVPNKDFFNMLYEKTESARYGSEAKAASKDDIRRRENIRNLEKELLGNEAAGQKWASYKKNKDIFAKSIYSQIRTEYDAMMKLFTEKLNGILDKNNADPDKRKEFFEDMSSVFVKDEDFDKAVDLFKVMSPDKE